MSSDYLVRSRQHVRRYDDTDLLCGFEIDNELELRRLLYGRYRLDYAPLRILST